MNRNAVRPLGAQVSPARARWTPPLSVVAASLLSWLPLITESGWMPNLGLLTLLAWRLLRPDLWTPVSALPLGLVHDIVTGLPLGLSMSLWPALLLLLDILDSRPVWRDYWLEWLIAVALLGLGALAEWQVAALMNAGVPLENILPGLVASALLFPVVLQLVLGLDRWRLSA